MKEADLWVETHGVQGSDDLGDDQAVGEAHQGVHRIPGRSSRSPREGEPRPHPTEVKRQGAEVASGAIAFNTANAVSVGRAVEVAQSLLHH